jgi:hypothetical protein
MQSDYKIESLEFFEECDKSDLEEYRVESKLFSPICRYMFFTQSELHRKYFLSRWLCPLMLS